MSNFFHTARNPKTGKTEMAEFLDDYYGRHIYGVRFPDGKVYREDELPDDVATVAPDNTPKKCCDYKECKGHGDLKFSHCEECNPATPTQTHNRTGKESLQVQELDLPPLDTEKGIEELVREGFTKHGSDGERAAWIIGALTSFEAKIRIDCWDDGFEAGIESERTRLHTAIEKEKSEDAGPRVDQFNDGWDAALSRVQDLLRDNKDI